MTEVEQRHDNLTTEQSWEDVAIPGEQPRDAQAAQCQPLDSELELGPLGIPPERRARLLDRLDAHLRDRRDHMLGYQVTEDMDAYQADLSRFMRLHLNNIGDPFKEGGYKVNTKPVERAVLTYFTKLWHGFPYRQGRRESCWGYALSMGATEGNLYAMWNARDYLEGRRLLVPPESANRPVTYIEPLAATSTDGDAKGNNRFRPVIFYSQDTHYSFAKAARVLKLPTIGEIGRREYDGKCPIAKEWPDEVPSELPKDGPPDEQYPAFGPGSIDVQKLVTLVDFFAGQGHPIVVNLNYGSTFKGAYDDVRAVCDALLPVFRKHGLLSREVRYEDGTVEKRRGFWIHVDGALGAGYMPFLAMAAKDPKYGYTPEVPIPEFDFGLRSWTEPTEPGEKSVSVDMVASIALSGHKWMGAPWPCGVLLTKVKYQMQPPGDAQYIGSLDTTFAGSRNGFSPLVMWDYLAQHPVGRQISKAVHSQRMAAYLVEQLKKVERYWQDKMEDETLSLYVDRTPLAITVRFRRPNPDIVAKYSLSTVSVLMRPDDPRPRHLAHAFLMSFTTQDRIDTFVLDLCGDDAFEFDTDVAALQPTSRYDTAVPPATFPFEDRGFA